MIALSYIYAYKTLGLFTSLASTARKKPIYKFVPTFDLHRIHPIQFPNPIQLVLSFDAFGSHLDPIRKD